MNAVTITLPIPDRCLSPNARAHWAKKSRAKKAQRGAACVLALEAMKGDRREWTAATIEVKWFGRTKKVLELDEDNAIASLKGSADGLQDAGLIVNDNGLHWKTPVHIAVDKKAPRVEITVTPTN